MELGNKGAIHIPSSNSGANNNESPLHKPLQPGQDTPADQASSIPGNADEDAQSVALNQDSTDTPAATGHVITIPGLAYQNTPLSANKGTVITGASLTFIVIVVAIFCARRKSIINRERAATIRVNQLNARIRAQEEAKEKREKGLEE